jgi:hypothetical protein
MKLQESICYEKYYQFFSLWEGPQKEEFRSNAQLLGSPRALVLRITSSFLVLTRVGGGSFIYGVLVLCSLSDRFFDFGFFKMLRSDGSLKNQRTAQHQSITSSFVEIGGVASPHWRRGLGSGSAR